MAIDAGCHRCTGQGKLERAFVGFKRAPQLKHFNCRRCGVIAENRGAFHKSQAVHRAAFTEPKPSPPWPAKVLQG